MKPPICIALAVVVVGLTLVGVGYAHPSWTADLGLDFWNVPELKARMAHDLNIGVELQFRDEQVLRRIAVKEALIEDLVRGRLSLLETAAEFRALNAGRKDYALVIRSLYPGLTDDERICHNVINYVESHIEANEDGLAFIHELRNELNHLKGTGRLFIPGPPLDPEPAAGPEPATVPE